MTAIILRRLWSAVVGGTAWSAVPGVDGWISMAWCLHRRVVDVVCVVGRPRLSTIPLRGRIHCSTPRSDLPDAPLFSFHRFCIYFSPTRSAGLELICRFLNVCQPITDTARTRRDMGGQAVG